MKRTLIATLVAGLALAPITYAEDAHHPDKDQPAAAPAQAPVDQTAQRMQENVKRMQSQLDRVRKTKDAGERERLLAEHMQTMRENMALGQTMMPGGGMGMMGGAGGMGMMGGRGGMGMMDPAMMDQCMKMMGGPPGAAGTDMASRMAQMEKRMDMMQAMMQRMAGPEAPAAGKTQ